MMDFVNALLAETTALEPNRIQPICARIAGSGSFGKGKNIAGNGGSAANKRVRSNANKMVYRTQRAHLGPLPDGDVAAESRGIGQNDVVADHAIMRDVGVRH